MTYSSRKARPTVRHETHQTNHLCAQCHVVMWLVWPTPEEPGLLSRLLADQSLDSFLVKVQRRGYCRAGVKNEARENGIGPITGQLGFWEILGKRTTVCACPTMQAINETLDGVVLATNGARRHLQHFVPDPGDCGYCGYVKLKKLDQG